MPNEDKLISAIVKQLISGDRYNEIEGLINTAEVSWSTFKNFVIYHDLSPFAYLVLKNFDASLPQDLKEFLKNNYYCAVERCEYLWEEFLRISGRFEDTGIALLPIKGMALLYDIYPHKPIRPMTDIDLLVKEDDLQKAEKLFCSLGYRKELYGLKEEYWRENQCHITFYHREDKKLPFVELHWGLDFKRRSHTILSELWNRIRNVKVDGRVIKLLSPEDTLFSLALHSRRYGRTLCLKNAYDTTFLLNKYTDSFDWDYCLEQSRKYNICTTLFFILYQCKLFSGLNIPEYVWKGLKIPFWKKKIIQHFIENNTFLTQKGIRYRNLYLKLHFLLYDSLWEPIDYILNIPKEQFAKYYSLEPYDEKTDFLYKRRLFYIPFKGILNLVRSK